MDHRGAEAEDNRGPQILAVAIPLVAVATIFVAARLYTKAVIKKLVYLEDYIIGFSNLLLWAEVGLYFAAVRHGEGRHIWTLTEEELEASRMWFIVASIPGVTALGLPKIAIALMLNRILFASKWLTTASWVFSGVTTMNFIAVLFLLVFQCSPIRAAWSANVADARCYDPDLIVNVCLYASVFSAITDLYFAFWPAVVILRLGMDTQKSVGLSCVLGLGVFVTQSACAVALYKVSLLPLMASPDFTYDCADLMIWTVAEASAILIASSIPMLTPIYLLIMRRRRDGENRNETRKAPVDELMHQLSHQRQNQIQRHVWDVETGVFHRNTKRQPCAGMPSSAKAGSIVGDNARSSGDRNSRAIHKVEHYNETQKAV
ncbi:uncharacterized protein PpBr36_10240 [Pyricularia pennisetigena]|uniref:uncharacterized protein n=1 Tax=Pyricularia pennisetigena TaxID=1578925 RepID=UPI00114E0521|nr:uncharacterized protein PpBr36_10240 [Pyricularia pennisetigena]TLS21392.1 hypothetical protein PpBr36_10240 [Pyricularia pennisetigena]